ncbi:MAG: hypothetical protein ABI721_01530 [Candidatus Dojkabacteria bacterium]
MRKKLVIIGLGVLFLLSILVNGSPFIFGDGYGYFHNAKTLVTTGSFLELKEPEYFPYTGHAVTEQNGKFVTSYPPGSSILLWPFLTVSKFFDSGTIYTDYYKAFDGHSVADGLAVLLAASFYAFLSLVIIYKILKSLGFNSKISLISVVVVYIGSYALSYTEQFASYSHIYEIFAVSTLLYFLIQFGKKFEYKYTLFAGAAAGLLVLIRPVDVVIVIPILFFVFAYRNTKSSILFILGAIPSALIFFLYNTINFGNPLSTGYGSSEKLFDFTKFNLVNLLFSDVRGWYIYSPVMLIGSIGLLIYAWRNRPSFLIYLAPCILLILTYSFWPNWWAGDSLGQRFFLVLIPFMAIGIAVSLRGAQRQSNLIQTIAIFFIATLTIYSLTITILYRITPTDELYKTNAVTAEKYPEVTPAERFTPFDILNYHKELIDQGEFKFPNKLIQGFNGGRSLLLLALGQTYPIAKLEKISDLTFIIHLIPNNINSPVISNVRIGIQQSSNYYVFTFKNVDLSKTSEIQLDCSIESDCVIKNSINEFTKEVLSTTEITSKQIELSSDLKIDFEAGENIKLVDYKLKNL